MNRLRNSPLPPVQLRDALNSGPDTLPDAELLDRFARYADHEAFAVLVRRHGRMVFGVCRRMLSTADADDAFQATFLVLIRKAHSVRGERLGPWLFGVACRVSLKVRSREARRAEFRTEATDMIPDPNPPADAPDWLPILDAELNALPAKYRDPLVLCELQGSSRAAAAKVLGIPEGTLSSRLSRGRDLLRKRLLKHGTLLPAGGLTVLLGASGVGRATVPAALLTRTAELAKVATGVASAGAVPVGAARLTDEVLKSMFLTKLRATAGAVVALALVAVGLVAALPAGADGAPPETKGIAKGQPDAKGPIALPQPGDKKPAAPGPKLSDRDALQGLWVIEKIDLGKDIPQDDAEKAKLLIGKIRILVAGDVWWQMIDGPGGMVGPTRAKLDPSKNPKWLDMDDPGDGRTQRQIYELSGDRLRICTSERENGRPAEFNTADLPVVVMEFRRDKMPPAAGEKALVGSWTGAAQEPGGRNEESAPRPTQRIEILDNHLFVYSTEKGRPPGWAGGRYTVDTTKNPKWVDVELVAPTGKDDKVTRLYGCYEVADGRLKMALGAKRATRPLEFTPADGVILFDLGPAKPAPRPVEEPGAVLTDDLIRTRMKSGDFAGAERLLRTRLPDRTKLDLAEDQLQLGICLLEQARAAKPADAPKLLEEAWTAFGSAFKEAGRPPLQTERTTWLKTQASIRGMQVLHLQRQFDRLLTTATALLDKHRGTVEELILLSLVFHAHQQKQEADKARAVRENMKEVFDRLPRGAFTAETGEYSRVYWEKSWFAEK